MTITALDPLAKGVLRALYELAELDCPAHAGVVSRALRSVELELRPSDVARVLLVLDARGLVVADRARLTMRGLAEAVRCPALQLERAAWLPQMRRQALQFVQADRPRAAGSGGRG
ncbi:MAG: hypothetical protein JWN04_5897 [Myxococcaceae bacterium]|nr:hypothetical protein [Myxococcaceae bacterium]